MAIVAEDEFFLDEREPIFVTHHRGAGTECVIIVPPLFEELARTRKVLVNLARDFSACGMHAVRFDYRGTGWSGGSHDELTLAGAFGALECVVAHCQRQGMREINLVGFRFGGYVALSARSRLPLRRVVSWEPVLDLAEYFQEMLRIEVSNQMVTLGQVKRTRQDLLAELRANRTILIDGYRVSPALERAIEAERPIDLASLAPQGDRLTFLFWENRKLHAAAESAGLRSILVSGVKFSWKHIRTLEPRSEPLFHETMRAVGAA